MSVRLNPCFLVRAGACLVPCVCAVGQAPPAAIKAESSKLIKSTVIKSNVEEVSFDLIVRDNHGRPIRDLHPEEVHIVDDGTPASIRTLRLVQAGQSAGAEQASKTGHGVTDPLREFRLVSLLFDRQGNFSAKLAHDAALEVIKTASSQDVYFSVWQIRPDIRLLQQFTTDQAGLKAAIGVATTLRRQLAVPDEMSKQFIHSLSSGPEAESQVMNGDLSAVGLGGGGGGPAGSAAAAAMAMAQQRLVALQLRILDTSRHIDQEQSAGPSISGLLALAREQDKIPGRKTILYFSDGLQMTSNTAEKFRSIISSANRAGVSIYTIDTSGLNQDVISDASQMMMSTKQMGAPQDGMTDSAGNADGTASAILDSSFRPVRNLDMTLNSNQQSAMKELAAATGGIFIGNTNDLSKPIRRIAEDINAFYEATYVPPSQNYDGHFRSISVKVDRPHAMIQSRSGYFSLPPDAGSGVAAFEMPLLKALDSEEARETIPLRSGVVRFGARNGNVRAAVVVQVPLSKIDYQRDDAAKIAKAHVGFLALIKNSNGEIVEKLSRDVGLQRPLQPPGESRSGTFTFERAFDIAPGNYTAHIAVSDQQGANISVKSIAFSIPAAKPGVGLSDISLVAHAEPVTSSADADDPFRAGLKRIVPEIVSDVRQNPEHDLPLFFVIYPDRRITNKPRLELALSRDNQPLGTFPVQLPDTHPGEPIPYVTSIRRHSLSAGSYRLLARVTQGSSTREQPFPFVVEGQPATATASLSHDTAVVLDGKQLAPEYVTHLDFLVQPKLLESTRPSNQQMKELLDTARERALDYQQDLPNLVCIERTLRSTDSTGRAAWKQKDAITRLLRYSEGREHGDILAVNGVRGSRIRGADTAIGGIRLSGEFGGLLGMVFSERAQAAVDWQGVSEVDGALMQVFRYRVAREHSDYAVIASDGRPALQTAYNALVYVDANTMAVRRISVEAQGIPANFPIQESAITVDYDYVPLGGHDYLLPQQAQLLVREHAHYLKKNDIKFLNYRRYGAESKIRFQ